MTALQYYEEQISKFSGMLGSSPPHSFYRELVLPQLRQKPNLAWKEQTTALRKKLEPATQRIIENMQSKFFTKNSAILEIGCGPLLNNESYLSRLFRHFHPFNWSFSDLIESSENLYLDLIDKLEWRGPLFDGIVGCNVLDTLPYDSYEAALKKMASILKPDGVLLHLADLNFFTTAFMDACAKKGGVLLPASDSLEMIYRIPQDAYTRLLSLSHHRISKPLLAFFSKWGTLHPQIQAMILNNAFLSHEDLSPEIKTISPLLEPHQENLRIRDIFENCLKAAASACNWDTLLCGNLSSSSENDLPSGSSCNYFSSDLLSTIEMWHLDVPPGKERIQSTIHVFCAAPQKVGDRLTKSDCKKSLLHCKLPNL